MYPGMNWAVSHLDAIQPGENFCHKVFEMAISGDVVRRHRESTKCLRKTSREDTEEDISGRHLRKTSQEDVWGRRPGRRFGKTSQEHISGRHLGKTFWEDISGRHPRKESGEHLAVPSWYPTTHTGRGMSLLAWRYWRVQPNTLPDSRLASILTKACLHPCRTDAGGRQCDGLSHLSARVPANSDRVNEPPSTGT